MVMKNGELDNDTGTNWSLPTGELEIDPEGQLLHSPAPADALYLPSSHAEHGPPSGPVKSALQMQSEVASLPAGELDPEGQLLHDPAPVDDLYLPDVHCEHVPPLGPVKPALHVQSVEASLPAVEDEPAMMPSRQLASPYRMHVAV